VRVFPTSTAVDSRSGRNWQLESIARHCGVNSQ
jgi:hypothetical protein